MKLDSIISSFLKALAIILSVLVLFPSALKLSHVFTHHEHQTCENDNTLDTHFHESDIDCDFYKFKITTQYYVVTKLPTLPLLQENFKISVSQYQSVSDFQKLQTALRGPPQFI